MVYVVTWEGVVTQADVEGQLIYDKLDDEDNEVDPTPGDVEVAQYTLSLVGPDLTFKRTLTEAVALSVMTLVMGGTPTTAPQLGNDTSHVSGRIQRDGRGASGHVDEPPQSLREYIDSTGATQYPQKVLAIASYLMDERGYDQVTRDDIKSQFSVARERAPANIHRDLNVALRNGWLAEDHVSKKFYVTGTGYTALEQQFSSEGKRSPRPARRRPRKRNMNGEATGA